MIAMQYGFTLPADYDMGIIERRIRDKGPLLDGFPRLRFKAYLSARREGADFTSAENIYAPFYLWDEPEGIGAFLTSPGFAALTRDFGWPSVQTWLVWQSRLTSGLAAARHATREILPIPPHSDLAMEREDAIGATDSAITAGALAAVTAFDPAGWRRLLFCLWPTAPETGTAAQIYAVGHVSLPRP